MRRRHAAHQNPNFRLLQSSKRTHTSADPAHYPAASSQCKARASFYASRHHRFLHPASSCCCSAALITLHWQTLTRPIQELKIKSIEKSCSGTLRADSPPSPSCCAGRGCLTVEASSHPRNQSCPTFFTRPLPLRRCSHQIHMASSEPQADDATSATSEDSERVVDHGIQAGFVGAIHPLSS